MKRRPAVLAAATLPAWWGGYLVLLYPPPLVEYAIGLAVAVVASAAVGVIAAVGWPGWQWPGGVPATVLRLPWRVLTSYLRVVAAGLRRDPPRGGLRTEPAAGQAGDDGGAQSRRALTGWLRSVTADEYVVGVDRDGSLTVHVLGHADGEPS